MDSASSNSKLKKENLEHRVYTSMFEGLYQTLRDVMFIWITRMKNCTCLITCQVCQDIKYI